MAKKIVDDNKLAYSIIEASKVIGVHYNTLYQMVRENKIPHKKIGKRIIFPKDTLIQWLNQDIIGV